MWILAAVVTAVAGGSVLVAGHPDRASRSVTSTDVARLVGLESSAATNPKIELRPDDVARVLRSRVRVPEGRTPAGTFLVGAARVRLDPAPRSFGGTTWMRDGCTSITGGNINGDHLLPPPEDAADELRSWPASSPDCVYLGGFGIGPVRPATSVGRGGVWIRAMAISNGARTFVYEIADLVGWFARYDATICADCGIRDVRRRVARELTVSPDDVVIASTHSHAAADTYGGWGGIPDWYRNQIRDSAIAAAKQAVANLRPAGIEVGEVALRDRNNERRDTYYSTADTGATWIQARALPPRGCAGAGCRPTLATLATYAAHPTIVESNVLHADWPGATARRLEERYGGVGLLFEGGLGNVSVTELPGRTDVDKAEGTGRAIADDIAADIDSSGIGLRSNDMRAAVRDIAHPATTNPGLSTLAAVGLFDREFTPGSEGAGVPGAYHWSKRGEVSTLGEDIDPEPAGEVLRGCTSAGPTVVTTLGAHRIGELAVAFAPGEIFSNVAEVTKERADRSATTMVIGQANDALGYIIQSFEYDLQGGAVTEYGTQTGEYEEVFSIDRCFGDHVLETLLESTETLGFGR
ncbi:MAG: hypothetical protein ACRDKJ_08760 [Actinomycetota bacterium]